MFEYSEELITSAQSDVESGLDVIDELLGKKSSTTSLESYAGKVDVNLVFTSLAFVKNDLEELDELIISTKAKIENGDISKYDYADLATLDMANIDLVAIYALINETPYLTDDQKKWAQASDYALYLAINIMYNKWAVDQIDEIHIRYSEALQKDSSLADPEMKDKFITEAYNEIFQADVEKVTFDDLKVYKTTLEKLYYDWNQELWTESYKYLDDINFDETYGVDVNILGDVTTVLSGIPYEYWNISILEDILSSHVSVQEHGDYSYLNFATFMYEDEGYREWFYKENGRELNRKDVIDNLGVAIDLNNRSNLHFRAFYMDEDSDIIKKYNWLYKNKGKNEAEDYLYSLENSLNEKLGFSNFVDSLKYTNKHFADEIELIQSYDFLSNMSFDEKMNGYNESIEGIITFLNENSSHGYDMWNGTALNIMLSNSELENVSMLNFAARMYEDAGYKEWYKNQTGFDLTKKDVARLLGLDRSETSVFLSDNPDLMANYNYILSNKGTSDANEYLHAVDSATTWEAFMGANNNFFYSVHSGSETMINNIARFGNRNSTMTVKEYEDYYKSLFLHCSEYSKEYGAKDLKELYKNNEISKEAYDELSSQIDAGNIVNGLDVAYANNEMNEKDYLAGKEVFDVPEYQIYKGYSGLGKSLYSGAGFGGNIVGEYSPIIALNIIPGVKDSPIGSALSSGIIFMNSYGENYAEYKRSGNSEITAVGGSSVRAAGDAGVYAFCQNFLNNVTHIPNNFKGSKILDFFVNKASFPVRQASQSMANDVIAAPIESLYD